MDESRKQEAERLLRVRRLLLAADDDMRPTTRHKRPPRTPRERALQTGERAYEPFTAVEETRGEDSGGDSHASRDSADRVEVARQVMRGRPRPRAAFWTILGETPQCGPGDLVRARMFHKRIIRALEQGGWTHSEQTQLGNLERKWGQRARGEDPRFVLVGNVGGRLQRGTERRIKLLRKDKGA